MATARGAEHATDDVRPGRRAADGTDSANRSGGDFFTQLATHWKNNYTPAGWTAWVLSPISSCQRDAAEGIAPVPMWNGPIECRLFRFDMVKGSARPSVDGATQPGV